MKSTITIDTEHLLLGLIQQNDAVGLRVLENRGVDRSQVRPTIYSVLEEQEAENG